MIEAMSVCFDSQNHNGHVTLKATGAFTDQYEVKYNAVTDQMRRSHNDSEVATENGAYGISILLIEKNTNYTAIEKSRKGTRFDYWLGAKDDLGSLFERKARLEVSGIRQGTDADINARVNIKRQQIKRSNNPLPAFVSVVEFSAPKAKVIKE